MKYCMNCNQNVNPVKPFKWGFFILTTLLFGIGLLYPIYWLVAGSKHCPICNGNNFTRKQLH